MGGAQHNQRKGNQRNQNQRKGNQRNASQAAKAVASARGVNAGRTKMTAAIVVIVVFAAAIIGAVLYSNNQKQAQVNDVITVNKVTGGYPVSVKDGIISAGQAKAPKKLDFYEDFICSSCGAFNQFYADEIETQLEKGAIQVNYHMLPFLDRSSDPPGYSGRAAAAAIAVATNTPAAFPSYFHSLYADQAKENTAGYTNDQLISLGKRLGVGGTFEQDVNSAKFKPVVDKLYADAKGPVGKANGGGFGTPTIIYNGQGLQVLSQGSQGQAVRNNWLQDLVNKK